MNTSELKAAYAMPAFWLFGDADAMIAQTNNGFAKDRDSLSGDWQNVGKDIRAAMDKFNNEQAKLTDR